MKFNFFKSSRCFNKAKTQKGFTLIELIIALAVIGAAVGGVLVFQSTAEQRQKLVGTTNAFTVMTGKIRNVWSPAGSFSGVSSANIASGGIVEKPFVTSGSNVLDPWGGTLGVASGGASNRWYGISMTLPTSDACTAFASAVSSLVDRMTIASSAPVWGIAASNTTIAAFHPSGTGASLVKADVGAPVDGGAIATGCGNSTRTVGMSFQYN